VPLQDELCFVQFIHPGKEHPPDGDGFKDWNRGKHKRKFLEIDGRCRRKGKPYEGPLRFWAEWEPQSEVITRIDEPLDDGPRFIYRPFYVAPPSYHGLQNTDPFVFDRFFYAGCLQDTKKGPTQLRYLQRGSVVLFGSFVRGQFALDTVFVVDECIDYRPDQAVVKLRDSVPRAYLEVTVATLGQPRKGEKRCGPGTPQRSLRLYSGATIDNPVNDMYSFFPCQPAKECPHGFARPAITIADAITDSLMMGKRLNRGIAEHRVKELWNTVRKQVESAGLWLGVHAEMPKRRRSSQ
jgi:hypothetical protein